MSPDRSSSPRNDCDPLAPFVQLVAPASHHLDLGSVSVDTRCGEVEAELSVPSSLTVESPDDILADQFPQRCMRDLDPIRDVVENFIAAIRVDLSQSDPQVSLEDDWNDSPRDRSIVIRSGPVRMNARGDPVIWVECRCQETQAYLLPDVRLGEDGARWSHDEVDRLPERFHDGPVRLLIELDPHTFALRSCRPLVSPQCAAEAESNFLSAVQGVGSSSYLLSRYHEWLVRHEVSTGGLDADLSEDERRDYLSSLSRPSLLGVSTSSEGELSVSLRYPETQAREAYYEKITLKDIAPWGLTVTGITRSSAQSSL